jgi:hypothetical protein
MTTRTKPNPAKSKRGELTRDRGPRQLQSAIDARRRLNTRREENARTSGDPHGPSDVRYAYLKPSHD